MSKKAGRFTAFILALFAAVALTRRAGLKETSRFRWSRPRKRVRVVAIRPRAHVKSRDNTQQGEIMPLPVRACYSTSIAPRRPASAALAGLLLLEETHGG